MGGRRNRSGVADVDENSLTPIAAPSKDVGETPDFVERQLRRVAFNLHDGPLQSLVAAEAMLDRAGRSRDSDTRGAQIAAAQGLLDHAVTQLRETMHDLRPGALDAEGVEGKIREYAEDFVTETGVPVSISRDGEGPALPSQTQEAVLRAVQEALTNVRRHAEASRVDIALTFAPNGVTCTVADDGCGFDAESVVAGAAETHWGLLGMAERAAMVGGDVCVASHPGMGTLVRVRVPVGEHWI